MKRGRFEKRERKHCKRCEYKEICNKKEGEKERGKE